MTGHLDKLDDCPECGRVLTQPDYDMQACACGWGPFGVPSKSWRLLDALAMIHEQGRET